MKRTRLPRAERLLVSRHEAAQMLGCHYAGITRLEEAGKLKPVKLGGTKMSKVRYRIADIERLIDACTKAV